MKPQSIQKLFAFIIAIMMFSVMPEISNAQNGPQKPKDPMPESGKGKGHGGGYCNCSVRPIPFQCGQICGFKTAPMNQPAISGSNSVTVSFELAKAQHVSLKIYDLNGGLIKTIAQSSMTEGEHQIEWNKTDEAGNAVNTGIYILQLDAGIFYDTKKLSVIK